MKNFMPIFRGGDRCALLLPNFDIINYKHNIMAKTFNSITEQDVIDQTVKMLYQSRENVYFLTPELYRLYAIRLMEEKCEVRGFSEDEKNRVSEIASKCFNDIKANLQSILTIYADDSDDTWSQIHDRFGNKAPDNKRPIFVIPFPAAPGSLRFLGGFRYGGFCFDNLVE